MSYSNGLLPAKYSIHEQHYKCEKGDPGTGFKLDSDANYDLENKKLTNVRLGDDDHDAMTKFQIERHIAGKTQYLYGVQPGQVLADKAVIYSPSGGVHANSMYLKDQYGQEVHFYVKDQDDKQIRLHVPNLKNNDSYNGV